MIYWSFDTKSLNNIYGYVSIPIQIQTLMDVMLILEDSKDFNNVQTHLNGLNSDRVFLTMTSGFRDSILDVIENGEDDCV